MEKRDLKADLEMLECGFYPRTIELIEIAEHAIERAMEAEKLNSDLLKALRIILDIAGKEEKTEHDWQMISSGEDFYDEKVREVLGHGKS